MNPSRRRTAELYVGFLTGAGALPRTLLVFAHPALERSRVNAALWSATAGLPELTRHDLYETYPDFLVDTPAEQARLTAHDVIVLQFPFYWYSSPALLKEWIDLVWLHGFAYGHGGRALHGRTLAVACTTGGRDEAYGATGHNRFSMMEFLRPWEATANLCGMRWAEPFVVHGAAVLDDGDLARACDAYRGWISGFAATRPAASIQAA